MSQSCVALLLVNLLSWLVGGLILLERMSARICLMLHAQNRLSNLQRVWLWSALGFWEDGAPNEALLLASSRRMAQVGCLSRSVEYIHDAFHEHVEEVRVTLLEHRQGGQLVLHRFFSLASISVSPHLSHSFIGWLSNHVLTLESWLKHQSSNPESLRP